MYALMAFGDVPVDRAAAVTERPRFISRTAGSNTGSWMALRRALPGFRRTRADFFLRDATRLAFRTLGVSFDRVALFFVDLAFALRLTGFLPFLGRFTRDFPDMRPLQHLW